MSDRGTSKKISQLIGKSVFINGDQLTFISNGQNFRIKRQDFLAAMGVLGTLTQKGDVTGAPVLEIDALNFGIRNIEPGFGNIASLTPSNGIKIDHTFISGPQTPLLIDINTANPLVRSLVAGGGIGITESTDGKSLIIGVDGAVQGSVEIDANYTQKLSDRIIWSTGDNTITLLDPALALVDCTFRSISGTITLAPSTGTTEITTITAGSSQRMGPRSVELINGWFALYNDAIFQVVETSVAYTAVPKDRAVAGNGTFNVTLFPSALAEEFITIKSVLGGGTITLLPDGVETIEGASTKLLSVATSVTLMPVAAGWLIV